MKKLNLNDTWKYCLRMWRWIAERKKVGDRRSVKQLKKAWVRSYSRDFSDIESNCFFCTYAVWKKVGCVSCPAVKIDKEFHCMATDYDFCRKPIQFYKRLRKLNRLRKLRRKL